VPNGIPKGDHRQATKGATLRAEVRYDVMAVSH
jgi:hypothetical protein